MSPMAIEDSKTTSLEFIFLYPVSTLGLVVATDSPSSFLPPPPRPTNNTHVRFVVRTYPLHSRPTLSLPEPLSMGGACGKSKFRQRYELRSESLLPFYDKLGLTHKDGLLLYKVFESIDEDASGSINLDEFFAHFELEFTPFAESAFHNIDVDKGIGNNHSLDFPEFFVGMWNYCTMKHDFMVKFAFDLFDRDGSGSMDTREVVDMVELVLGKTKRNKTVKDFINKLDKDGSGDVSLDEWYDMNRRCQSLLMPAWELQRKLRHRVVGPIYWERATRTRLNKVGKFDLIELFHHIKTGEKLDRKKIEENAVVQKEARVLADAVGGVDVVDAPRSSATVLRSLAANQSVIVYEERPDENHNNPNMWYLIAPDRNEWVCAEFLKLDATWLKYEAEQERKRQRDKEAVEERKRAELDRQKKLKELHERWAEARDPKTKRKYWYNNETHETTWKNPFKAYEKSTMSVMTK